MYFRISLRVLSGGVRDAMYTDLPRPLVSKTGFQGCFASFETNSELLDPVKHALVPSPLVEEGCEGTYLLQYNLIFVFFNISHLFRSHK